MEPHSECNTDRHCLNFVDAAQIYKFFLLTFYETFSIQIVFRWLKFYRHTLIICILCDTYKYFYVCTTSEESSKFSLSYVSSGSSIIPTGTILNVYTLITNLIH